MDKSQLVHITNGALDDEGNGTIILRGVVDPDSFELIKVDSYQREEFPLTMLKDLLHALEEHQSLPDIELGMRGEDFDSKGEDFWLKNPVYNIDGQQRVIAARHFMTVHPDIKVRLGAMIHFNTTFAWEKDRFLKVNAGRKQVSANVILRNMKDENRAILTLYGLSNNDKEFALYNRICWNQRMTRNELMTARSLAGIVFSLHCPPGESGIRGSATRAIAPGLLAQADQIGLMKFRHNIKKFFETMESCWDFNSVQYRERASFIRQGFLMAVAKLFSNHETFWDGNELQVSTQDRKKLATFPLQDQYIATLCGGGHGATSILYEVLLKHMEKSRRSKMVKRATPASKPRRKDSNGHAGKYDDHAPIE